MELTHVGPGSALPAWVEALEREAFGEAWGPLDDLEQLWALEGIGYARWQVIPAAAEAELLRIAVSPAARGKGQGRRLLAESSEALRALGVSELYLEVRVSNTAARSLYEAEGWVFTGIRKAYYRDGEDAALYGKTLSLP